MTIPGMAPTSITICYRAASTVSSMVKIAATVNRVNMLILAKSSPGAVRSMLHRFGLIRQAAPCNTESDQTFGSGD